MPEQWICLGTVGFSPYREGRLVKVKARMQVQCKMKQKYNSKLDDNNDRSTKPGGDTRKGRESTN